MRVVAAPIDEDFVDLHTNHKSTSRGLCIAVLSSRLLNQTSFAHSLLFICDISISIPPIFAISIQSINFARRDVYAKNAGQMGSM